MREKTHIDRLTMDARDRRAQEIQDKIRTVLLENWNPIGSPVPVDEYDGYVGGIYRLLFNKATVSEVAEHLASVEDHQMGFQVSPESLSEVAAKLCEIDVRLDQDRET